MTTRTATIEQRTLLCDIYDVVELIYTEQGDPRPDMVAQDWIEHFYVKFGDNKHFAQLAKEEFEDLCRSRYSAK